MLYPLAAPAVLALAALLSWAVLAVWLDPGRLVAALGAWAALAVVALSWSAAQGGVEFDSSGLGFGAGLGLRLDPLTLAFQFAILVPVALHLTLRDHPGGEAGLGAAAAAAALVAVEAKDMLLTAVALGTAASLAMLVLRRQGGGAGRWTSSLAASLALGWAGATLQVTAGTSEYAAVPVSALAGPVFALIAIAGLATAGLLPWRTWLVDALANGRGGGLPAALLLPLGLYLMARTYAAGGGGYPSPWLNVALSGIGAATVVVAGVRSQAARDRPAYLADAVAAAGGFALLAIGIGTPVGLIAGISASVIAGVSVALLALAEDRGMASFFPALALAAGVPPGLTFGSRLIALQSAIEARDLAAFFGLAAAAGWLLLLAGGARAIRLPAAPEPGSRWASALCGVAILAGVGVGFVEGGLGVPAAAAVMPAQGAAMGGLPASVATTSGAWFALGLGAPLLLLALIAIGPAGLAGGLARGRPSRRVAAPPPIFVPPWGMPLSRLAPVAQNLAGIRLGGIDRLTAAMARGSVALWVAVFAALSVAVTR